MNTELLLAFDDERHLAEPLAQALGVPLRGIERHRFPDGESRLRLPPALPRRVALLRGLQRPNDKLAELLIAAPAARELGAAQLTLVCPYLAYMRQDMAFTPGEAVSQRHVGRMLAAWFDAVITVDPHLHRVATMDEVLPGKRGLALSAAPLLGAWAARHASRPILLGPDEEAAPWVRSAAAAQRLQHATCIKQRRGDREVQVTLPGLDFHGREVVLIDDVASTGRTLAVTAEALRARGASAVDVAVTHALFVDDAVAHLERAGVRHVWSSDSVPHPSNVVSLVPLLAAALRG
ncbi:MAG TPA: ribose-phosphate diphosphokinase [Rubrivivax sp.]|nr:ribose-phosphate diphosphokinase [Rubrivivax sp.]